MKLDSTILAVIIGSGITILGTTLNNIFNMHKERKIWERKKEDNENRENFNRLENRREELKILYSSCINNLLKVEHLYRRIRNEAEEDTLKTKIDEHLFEVQNTLSVLSVIKHGKYGKHNLTIAEHLDRFTIENYIGEYLDFINSIIAEDSLFPGHKNTKKQKNKTLSKLSVKVSDELRKEMFIEEKFVKPAYDIEFNLFSLSKSQRELLWESNSLVNSRNIPRQINLRMPKYTDKNRGIITQPGKWLCPINPTSENIIEIFNLWENDYLRKLEIEKEKLQEDLEQSD